MPVTLIKGGWVSGNFVLKNSATNAVLMTFSRTAGITIGTVATGLSFTGAYTTTAIQIGTSSTAITLAAKDDHVIDIYTTCASTDGSTSVRPIYMKSTMTGAAGVGGRAEFHMYTNVALGGWSNAIKGYVEYGATGKTTGLGSAIVGEMSFGVGNTNGTYAPLESELVADTTAPVTGTATSFLYCNIAGSDATGKTNLNTYGFLFELGAGITDTTGGIFEAESITDADFTHVLKCRIAGTTYYLGLNTAKTM